MKKSAICIWVGFLILVIFSLATTQRKSVPKVQVKRLKIIGHWASPARITVLDALTGRQTTIWSKAVHLDQVGYLTKPGLIFFTVINSAGLEVNSIRPNGLAFRHLVTLPKGSSDVTIFPEANRLAYVTDNKDRHDGFYQLTLIDLNKNHSRYILKVSHPSVVGGLIATPDGRHLSFWRDDGFHRKLFIVGTDDSAPPRRIFEYPGHQQGANWSLDGKRLLFLTEHVEHGAFSWVVYNLETGKVEGSAQQPLKVAVDALWASDNSIVECIADASNVKATKSQRPRRYALRTLDGKCSQLPVTTKEFDPTAVVEYEAGK